MNKSKVPKVTVNTQKNTLYITMTDIISKQEMENIYNEIQVCVQELLPGFHVLADYSKCTLIHVGSFPTFRKMMKLLVECNVGEVVRVIGRSKIVYNQLSRTTTENIQGYVPIYVSTLEEAEEKLSKII